MSSNEPEGNSSRTSKVGKGYLMIRTCVMSISITHYSKSNSNKRFLLLIPQIRIMVIIINKNTLKEIKEVISTTDAPGTK